MSEKIDDDALRAQAGTPRFRLWPPVAVSVPWLIGFAVERSVGSAIEPTDELGLVLRSGGWLLVLLFVCWNGWCLWLFARHRTGLLPGQATTALLSSGPYRWSRNPLYVGLLVCYAGAALVTTSIGALVLLPVAWAALQWGAVIPEERYLRATVGEPYLRYARRVRRWL